MSQHILGSILVIALTNLDFKMSIFNVRWKQPFLSVSLSLLQNFCKISVHVVLMLVFSLIKLNLFFMWLGKCNYICMQVCMYVVTFILLTSHNLLYEYANDKTIQLHQEEPFWAYGKFGSSLPQNCSTLCFVICCKAFLIMICCKNFLGMMVHNRWTKVILTLVIFFKKSFFGVNEKFSFLPSSVQRQLEIPSSEGN